MNLKRICTSLVIAILAMVLIAGSSTVFAATASTPLYLKNEELRTYDEPNMAYAIRNPNDGGHIIWNIVKYDSPTSNSYTSKNIYCINPNIGFGSDENDTTNKNPNGSATYDTYYNMKTQSDTVKGLSSITDKEITLEDNTKISSYNAILALGDMLYLPHESENQDESENQEKEELLKVVRELAKTDSYASNYVEGMETYPLTDDDINAVQQAAIWYFSNYGEEKYNQTNSTSWLNYKKEGMTGYTSLSDYNQGTSEGIIRNAQANVLYKYLIDTAKANAKNYSSSSSSTGAPAKVNTTALNYEESNSNYIIGPINITENAGNTLPYTIDFVVKNGETEISNCKLLDSNKNEVASGTKVKDLVGQNFYISVPKDDIATLSVSITINYSDTTLTLWTKATDINATQPVMMPEKKQEQVSATLTVTPNSKPFDLALRKYITKVNGVEVANTRVPTIDESTISSTQTATYKHRKDPVLVEKGNIVTYKLTIYNEGEKDGRATKIVDQLPTGLKFSKVVSGNFDGSYDATNNTVNLVRKSSNTTNLHAYSTGSLTSGSGSETIEIECEVTATANTTNSKVLTNVAWIAEEIDSDGNVITNQEGLDIDSEPSTKPSVNKDNMENYTGNGNKEDLSDSTYYYKGQQDDDDFEKLVLMPQSFDLKLIKRITAVNDQNVTERIESIDVSNLNKVDSNGNFLVDTTSEKYTTAEYELNKEPVSVKKGDIVTYTFRIYNEGTIDGYASEITEDIPEGLEFLWSDALTDEELEADTTLTDAEKAAIEFNRDYYWTFADNTLTTIKTNYLDIYEGQPAPNDGTEDKRVKSTKNLIKAFDNTKGYVDTETEKNPDYKEVSVMLKVVSENVTGTVIRNEACISEDTDENGDPVDDRDSDTEKWVKYEDDEDYDNIILKSFDLALRKFIIAISDDTNIENEEYLKNEDGSYKRAPKVDTSKLNTLDENGKMITTAIYNHTKEPVLVKKNDIVVYNLRVYNEGEIDGYASEIKDHLPPYLEFVDSDFNEQYGWEVSEDGRTVTTRYLENELIKKAVETPDRPTLDVPGGEGVQPYVLSYKEVPIMCKVKDTAKTSENITNIADITEYLDENKKPVNDRDSQKDNVNLPEDDNLPGYKDDETGEYIPGQQDDDDFEKVIVKEFDLALRKWVTQAIVIDSNGQTVTETGHDAWDDPEQVVKVELHRKKLNEVTVKFRYSIRVYNQGDIAGYAKEVTDYVPEGLKFVAEDNQGWTDEGNNVISTRLLENTLLQPGEYADVEVILTWINNQENMGVMTNTAEISEDYNDYGVPDKDSTPDNKKPGEDDIDDAPVMLSISTGQMRIYFTLGFVVLITIAGGVVLIRKFVL
ncbi:MAG: hypothetical protein ACI4VH_04860 [Clostridia bacterium]